MKLRLFFIPVIIIPMLASCGSRSGLRVDQVWCNDLLDPVGIEGTPAFRWTVVSAKNGTEAVFYELEVEQEDDQESPVWSTGMVPVSESVEVVYSGPELEPARGYEWKVRVWDREGNVSKWSREGRFVTGIPDELWAPVEWIAYEVLPDSEKLVPAVHGSGNHLGNLAKRRPVIPDFRKEFSVAKPVEEAYLFISGLGHYTITVDGKAPDQRFLAPGWTLYSKSCLYNGYDITESLKRGSHAIAVTVGNGFFNVNRERYRKLVVAWGCPMMRLNLVIRYQDGSVENIVSDGSWKTAPSATTFTSIYGGEDYDGKLQQEGWNLKGFDDSKWQNSVVTAGPGGAMCGESDYPLKIMQSFEPVKITRLADTSWVYDFGQNASGIPEITVTEGSGTTLRLTPAELVNDDGSVNQRASGGPMYFDYTPGAASKSWKPSFTYYGLRYVGLTGGVPAGEANPGNLPVVGKLVFHHTRNSAPETGSFQCSNDLFNRIHQLIDWSIRSNLASVTTDCPHREKLGWLEQTHLVGNSIAYRYDIKPLYTKIIGDMIESQLENGLVPDIAPEYVPFVGGFRDSPEWGSSAVIIPWYMYEWYGDKRPMQKAWDMMNRYVDYLSGMAKDGILDHGLGDWFDMGPGPMGEAQLTPRALTATAIWFYDLKLLSQMAVILDRQDEGRVLASRADSVKTAFNQKFYDPATHVISTGSQTAYAMPLVVGLVPEEDRQEVFKNLIQTVERDRYALTAGDVGYRYLVKALQDAGANDVIWKMNFRDDVPGYGFQLKHGATSLTESWAALREVSNNHMMLGHLMEWLYSGIGGIRQAPGSAGYRHIIIDPQPVGDLTFAEVSHTCIRGEIRVRWEKKGDSVVMEFTIPVGSDAEVGFGGKNLGTFAAGKYNLTIPIN